MKLGQWQTDGGRDLHDYLESVGLSLSRFCEDRDLDRVQVGRAMRGIMPKRVSLDFALSIERATDGVVKAPRWSSNTAQDARAA